MNIKPLVTREAGVTGLETAIILIAFVVVASVFAFTVLSTGIFSAEQGKETIFAGHEQVSGSIELKGSIIANGVVDKVIEDAEDAWDDIGANVTASTDATDKKLGSAGGEITVAGAFTTGLLAYENFFPALDLSSHDSIALWIKSSVATTEGQLELLIDDTTDCASPAEAIDLPALAADTWKRATVSISAATTRTAIDCVGLQVTGTTLSSSQAIIHFDDIEAGGQVTSLVFTIANSVEGEAVDLTSPSDADNDGLADSENRVHTMLVSYSDGSQRQTDMYWTKSYIGTNDNDELLEPGERVEITLSLKGLDQTSPLTADKDFFVEIRAGTGGSTSFARTTPSKIDTVMNLK